jgi:hypothetical protein
MDTDKLNKAALHLRMWAESRDATLVHYETEALLLADYLEELAVDVDEGWRAVRRWCHWNLGDGAFAEEIQEVFGDPKSAHETLDEAGAPRGIS